MVGPKKIVDLSMGPAGFCLELGQSLVQKIIALHSLQDTQHSKDEGARTDEGARADERTKGTDEGAREDERTKGRGRTKGRRGEGG